MINGKRIPISRKSQWKENYILATVKKKTITNVK
jgi:hypothetical protein